MRRLIVLGALFAATALVLGPARGLLPGALLMSSPGTSLVAPGGDPAHAGGEPAQATARPAQQVAPGNTAVTVGAQALAKAADGYALTATVRTSNAPVGNVSVRFYEVVDLFGEREMLIGSALTDGSGAASISYLPARIGSHEIVARTTAAAKSDAAIARFTFESSVAAPAYAVQRAPLASFSDRVPYAVGLVVLAVWALIAFALLATARGVIGGARSSIRKGETA